MKNMKDEERIKTRIKEEEGNEGKMRRRERREEIDDKKGIK